MELSEYIEATIYSVMKGIKNSDKRLQVEGIGEIWKEDFNTASSDLVNLKMGKGQKDGDPNESIPILVFEYNVNLVVTQAEKTESSSEISASAKLLNVITFNGSTKAGSGTDNSKATTQNLKFSIPVSYNEKT